MDFRLVSDYKPKGDEANAIDKLTAAFTRREAASRRSLSFILF
jgi:excinuclease UvrABC helicase subunit UvrB